jgi:hypothetical protein
MKFWAAAYLVGLVLSVMILMYGIYEYKAASRSPLAFILVGTGAASMAMCVSGLYLNFNSVYRGVMLYETKPRN